MAVAVTDLAELAARWIDAATAERAGLFRVSSADGALLIGRNGSGDWSGLAIPNVAPGQTHAREYRLRLDSPELELKPDGSTRPKAAGSPLRRQMSNWIRPIPNNMPPSSQART